MVSDVSPTPADEPAPKKKRQLIGCLFQLPVALGALAVTGVSILSLLGRWVGEFDLLTHNRLQYATLMLIATIAAALTRAKALTMAIAALLLFHVVPLVPMVIGPSEPEGLGPQLRVIQFNVLTSNSRITEAAEWLVEQDADVIVAQETDQVWADGLDDGLPGWQRLPTETIRSDNFGMAVFVRDQLDVVDVEVYDINIVPSIATKIQADDDSQLLIYAIHALPPTSRNNIERARSQFMTATDVLDVHEGPKMLVGDLNTTRWSSTYKTAKSETGLRDSADGRGLSGTWPSQLWFTGMITIDHVWVSDDIRVERREVGPHLGSDHRPVVVDAVVVDANN